jgi:hypothetical protein
MNTLIQRPMRYTSVLTAIVLCLLITSEVRAQSGLAIIQYEHAEAAFARGELPAAVSYLNEAQRLFGGPNAAILRMAGHCSRSASEIQPEL